MKFKISIIHLTVPSLEMICAALQVAIIKEICDYAADYEKLVLIHLTTETEIQIVNGALTADSCSRMIKLESEWGILQYKCRLYSILGNWRNKICGQPIGPCVGLLVDCQIDAIINEFENYIYNIQIMH